jgi:hypothetical protein
MRIDAELFDYGMYCLCVLYTLQFLRCMLAHTKPIQAPLDAHLAAHSYCSLSSTSSSDSVTFSCSSTHASVVLPVCDDAWPGVQA